MHLALCDPADSTRETLQRDLRIEEGYASFDTAISKGFDGVFICTPPSLHVAQAARALEASCDVFVEKPLSDRLDGIDALC
ncbi:MAG: Gfo/Idh/MocA family oxidoreductase, partial [Candidatus Rokubacteria bacterium]|nr:Gfo/Idh/MocA family oxidoreductase [Candidatus Rokubacteria bacterium]